MNISHILYMSEIENNNPFSGAENHIWTLLPALVMSGEKVELIVILWNGKDFSSIKERLTELSFSGVRVTTIQRSFRKGYINTFLSKLSCWHKLWKFLQLRKDHIIHIHLEIFYTPLIAWLAGCRKITVSIHNDEPNYDKVFYRFRFLILKLISIRYIAITDHVRSYFLRASRTNPSNVKKVYYGISLSQKSIYSRQDFEIPSNKFVVGYVGRLSQQKNLYTLIDALHYRPDIIGVFVGNGPEKDGLIQYANQHQVRNVRFLGSINDASRVMPIFDVLCLPSLWEGLGLVLLEAMLQKVPIIGSRRGAIPEILDQGNYGILAEPTSEGIGNAIDTAHENPDKLHLQADKAYVYVCERFSVSQMIEGTREFYHSL